MTTDQKEFVEGIFPNVLPPSYERKNAPKKKIVESELWEYDIKTFKSRIGLITNIGTELYALLPTFEKGSPEYNEVLNRLKICNCFQSMEIDRAKGIKTMDIPKYWTKWERIEKSDSDEIVKLKELHHKTICDKRPYFFRYLYKNYDTEYKKRLLGYDNYCQIKYHDSLKNIIAKKQKSEKEEKTIYSYFRYGNLLESDCTMNRLCRYMENNIKELKLDNKNNSFDMETIIRNRDNFKDKNYEVIRNIYQKYRKIKKDINYHSSSSGFQDSMRWLREQANIMIDISSEEIVWWASKSGMSFLLDVFSEDFINVLKELNDGQINIAIKSDDGYIEYLGSKYEIRKIEV